MEPAFQSAATLAADLRERRIGCLELLNYFIARVERFNPGLNAIVVFDFDRARVRAREADAALARGEVWGPLHGVPMTIKDSYDVEGLPTTWGVPELRDNVAKTNAVAVDRLLAAGAVIFGKTNIPFNLADFQSYNDIYGTTNNPGISSVSPGGRPAAPRRPSPPGLPGSRRGATSGVPSATPPTIAACTDTSRPGGSSRFAATPSPGCSLRRTSRSSARSRATPGTSRSPST